MILQHDNLDLRLSKMLRWLAPTVISFAIAYGVMGALFSDWRTIASAASIGMHGMLTVMAQVELRHGRRYRATYLVGFGSMVATLMLTLLQPALYPSFAVVPLLIAAVLLHYAPRQHVSSYLLSCCANIILIVVLGELVPERSRLPTTILDLLRLSSLLAICVVTLVMLGQFSSRLQNMLAHLRAAYDSLESQHTQLARLSDQHELILNSAGEGIYGVDAQGLTTFLNPAAARMFGWDVHDLIGQQMHAHTHHTRADGSAYPFDACPITSALREGDIQHRTDEVFWRKDGTSFPVEYVSTPIHDHGTIAGAVILFRDISERIQAQAALEAERAHLARRVEERTADLSAANVELARASRLKDEFLASMSHELRTPLTAILGLSEALQEGIYEPLDDLQLKPIRMIEHSGRHLLELINDILDLAKIGAGKMELECESLDLLMVCQASLQLVKQQALNKKIKVSTRIDPLVSIVYADERRLKQILVNLLSNAVKFTAEGGAVNLAIAGDREAQVVRLTVSDTGIGIAQEDLSRLFQPFMQLDSRLRRQYEGSGLGLALVARMVELHGGSVAVESVVGQGSRFTVSLPWSEALELSSPSAPLAPPARATSPIPFIRRALIIHGSPADTGQLSLYLSQLGVEYMTHPHGRDALARALAVQPDAILLDIQLPDCSGWDVLAQLKADPRMRAIPVLVLSAEDDRQLGLTLGANAALVKPVTLPQFKTALRNLLPSKIDAVVQTSFSLTPALAADEQPVVLLAEDNEINITTLADYLQVKGYRVVVARNGIEALARAREVGPDIVIMDMQMPEMDGLEATRRIRADVELAEVPIIAVTAFAMPGDRERCLAAGANDYMSKPVSLKALVASLEALLAHQAA